MSAAAAAAAADVATEAKTTTAAAADEAAEATTAAAADVAAEATTAAEQQQQDTQGQGQRRCTLGLSIQPTLEPLKNVLDYVVCFPVPQLEIQHILKTKDLHLPDMCPTELLVAGATTTAVRHLQQRFSAPSSVGGWACQPYL